ncbi:MAG: methanogenesis marker 14 protein [Methanobacteriaceae archaeon]|nr:methanogenesis marker 14 protein [Methanobacteriaceae archaeon]
MSIFGNLFNRGPKPQIAHSQTEKLDFLKASTNRPQNPGFKTRPDIYYVVGSVELGNTTTKCLLTATNLNSSKSYLLDKTVKMTRDIRKPKADEEVFGSTVWGIELSKESVADLIKDTVLESLRKANIDKEKDLDFVVRSTGVTAGFATTEEVGKLVIALADGCLNAGIPPKKMAPAMTPKQLPERLQKYTLLDNVMFDGAVVSTVPPKGREVVANEMEGELVTAGIKLGSKWTEVDYRNPCVSLDFGSTLAGRIVNNDEPYASTIGNFLGLAGVISDSLARGSKQVDPNGGAALDLYDPKVLRKADQKKAKENAVAAHELINITKVPEGMTRFGTVPLNSDGAKAAGTTLIGCDVGTNADGLPELMELGGQFYDEDGLPTLLATMDHVSAMIVDRLLDIAFAEKLVVPGSVLGITGRAGITGHKPNLILEYTKEKFDKVVFVEDGLGLGAAIMARCMNSMGTQKNPLGGNQGDHCILKKRMQAQGSKYS